SPGRPIQASISKALPTNDSSCMRARLASQARHV
ncbi:hypothetical protein Pmar_PMAR009847, partial [Perkinsus marinus ATCC 50983]